ncbi:SRPBCC family protein [Pseudonocardia sp. RS010]|uniref:SRPBCC family protein n=1 Tax=Pseudonocardia sp. RS010 TaxID=3385979 RepID=UPI00399F6A6B
MDGDRFGRAADATELRLDRRMSVEAGVGTVFEVLVSEESVAQWMTGEVVLDPVAGGEVRVAAQGFPTVAGVVAEIDPPRRLSLVWQAEDWSGPLRTTIELRQEGDQTELSLVETGFGEDGELERTRSYLWSHWLIRLAATVAQRRGTRRAPSGR